MDLGLGSLIGAGVSAISGMIGANLDYKNNKKLMTYQHDMAVADWERQNAYNSPVQQMARLKEAGLNPYLMYSQGSTGNSSTGVVQPKYTMTDKYQRSAAAVNQAIQTALQIRMQKAQIKNLEAQNSNINQDTQMKMQQTRKEQELALSARNDALLGTYNLDIKKRTYQNEIRQSYLLTQQSVANIESIYSSIGLNSARSRNLAVDTINKVFQSENIRLQAEEIRSRIHLNSGQFSNLMSMIALRASQSAYIDSQKKGVDNTNSIFKYVSEKVVADLKLVKSTVVGKNIQNFTQLLEALGLEQFGMKEPGKAFGGSTGVLGGLIHGSDISTDPFSYDWYNRSSNFPVYWSE